MIDPQWSTDASVLAALGSTADKGRAAHAEQHARLYRHWREIATVPECGDGDSAATCTAAIQAAIDATKGPLYTYSGRIMLPRGVLTINKSLAIGNAHGLVIQGSGDTILRWEGPADKPLFDMPHTRECVLSGFRTEAATPLLCAVRLYRNNAEGMTTVPTHNVLRDMWLNGSNGLMQYGVVVGGLSADDATCVDANNDFHELNNVRISHFTTAGVLAAHKTTQAYNLRFINLSVTGWGKSTTTAYDFGAVGASAHISGGFISASLGIKMGRSGAGLIVDFVNSEGCKQFLQAPGTSFLPIHLRGCRLSGNAVDAETESRFIHIAGKAQVIIENCRIGSGGDDAPIRLSLCADSSAGSHVIVRNTTVYSNIDQADIWDGRTPDVMEGCAQIPVEAQLVTSEVPILNPVRTYTNVTHMITGAQLASVEIFYVSAGTGIAAITGMAEADDNRTVTIIATTTTTLVRDRSGDPAEDGWNFELGGKNWIPAYAGDSITLRYNHTARGDMAAGVWYRMS